MQLLPSTRYVSGCVSISRNVLTCLVLAAVLLESAWVCGQDAPAAPAGAATKASDLKTKPFDKDKCDDKRTKEKREALSGEKQDLNVVDNYYRDCLFARFTQPSPEAMNAARRELLDDISVVERKGVSNPQLSDEYNNLVIRHLREIIFKDKDNKSFHPSVRVDAVTVIGRLNQKFSTSSPSIPEVQALKTLIPLISPKENDGIVSAALAYLPRHLRFSNQEKRAMEADKQKIVQSIAAFLEAQKSNFRRTKEADDYLREQIIESLTIIATGSGESAKQAEPILTSLILPPIVQSKTSSEWLTEKSLDALGHYEPVTKTPEDIQAMEKGTIQFILASISSWKKRCNSTTAAAGANPYGGREGGKPGLGGGAAGGMMSEGGAPGSGGGGPTGAKDAPKKNPFDEQPKEVLNARRILHQRLERIHYGIAGTGKKSKDAPTKGLIMFVDDDEKDKLNSILDKIEKVQKALNDEKISDMSKLSSVTRQSIKELQEACATIVDHKLDEVEDATGETPESETSETGDGGSDGSEDAFGAN